jgi:hypothetical protein
LLVSHFTSRTTNELLENKYLKSILTCGSNSIFNEAQRKHPLSFLSGKFASCNFFISLVLDPHKNSSTVLQSLFAMRETRQYFCPLKNNTHKVGQPQEDKILFVLQVTKSMFKQNSIAGSNVASLIAKWESAGLDGGSCLQCQGCKALRANKKTKRKNPDGKHFPSSSSCRLTEQSIISFPQS